MVFEFTFDTHNKEEIKDAIIRLNELRGDLDKTLRLIELREQNEIHVGDTVKVIDTGMMCTTGYSFFQDEIRQYDKNDTMFDKLIELSSRYDYGKSWYRDGITSLKDEFRVEYIASNNGLRTLVVITTANSNYRKSYLIEFSGLKKC